MSNIIYKALELVECDCMCVLCEHKKAHGSDEPCVSCGEADDADGNFAPNEMAVQMAERILFLKSQE